MVAGFLKPFSDYLEDRNMTFKEVNVLSLISKAKAKGLTPKDLSKECATLKSSDPSSNAQLLDTLQRPQLIEALTAHIYRKYQRKLVDTNSLDFDDLLVYGVDRKSVV